MVMAPTRAAEACGSECHPKERTYPWEAVGRTGGMGPPRGPRPPASAPPTPRARAGIGFGTAQPPLGPARQPLAAPQLAPSIGDGIRTEWGAPKVALGRGGAAPLEGGSILARPLGAGSVGVRHTEGSAKRAASSAALGRWEGFACKARSTRPARGAGS